jgi:hypothetical protein
MTVRGTPAEVQAKWASRTAAASGEWVAGVNRVTQAPGQAAAAAADKWLMAVTNSKDKFRTRVGAVTLEAWKAATAASQARLADGVNRKKDKVGAFMAQFLPFASQVSDRVRAMPSTTFEDRIARMVANARGLAEFRRTG